MLSQPLLSRIILAAAVLSLFGCGNDGQQLGSEGTVQLDKAPLQEGYITFTPQLDTSGPSAGSRIENGRFSIESEGGTFVGTFRVEITAMRKTGRKISDPIGQLVDELEQYLPARYNKQSELTAKVTKEGPNKFEFELQSK